MARTASSTLVAAPELLVDNLLEAGVGRIAVLDISEQAIEITRARLGERAERVDWIVADVVDAESLDRFDVWHDRATFHFLTNRSEQSRYVALCEATLPAGGTAVMATFASDGPTHCGGPPVTRYDPTELEDRCGPGFDLIDSERHRHLTPTGVEQRFLYASFSRAAGDPATG